jgi:hypothetical protein
VYVGDNSERGAGSSPWIVGEPGQLELRKIQENPPNTIDNLKWHVYYHSELFASLGKGCALSVRRRRPATQRSQGGAKGGTTMLRFFDRMVAAYPLLLLFFHHSYDSPCIA